MRRITVSEVTKTFTLHNQGGTKLPVIDRMSFHVDAGECVVFYGPSGCGKSTLLKMLFGNYLADQGSIEIHCEEGVVDLVRAHPHEVLTLRQQTLGFVSQFLRVIPRVSTWDLVCDPLKRQGVDQTEIEVRVAQMLKRLNLPESLWHLAPATFSGGEQQRVNIARSLILDYPIVLLDEPTASLDASNREVVAGVIADARERGAALAGIFHDDTLRNRVADRLIHLEAVA
ncbi:MAG: Alpha-D-ribose 1-methylphosphonate 5-triphosphate synthase subunit PhnL [Gammaproteobacteria bacterium]|nr:MAG: Alpha-D-ribose 1-methylphosphonate 5-triphosphate synthase subunit PhnL [Gammaproteobacteria bacterium]